MSTTYIAILVSLLTLAFPAVGVVVVDQDTLTKAVMDLVGVGALIYALYGRYKAGGISAFGLRKK